MNNIKLSPLLLFCIIIFALLISVIFKNAFPLAEPFGNDSKSISQTITIDNDVYTINKDGSATLNTKPKSVPNAVTYPAWDENGSYEPNVIVTYEGKNYEHIEPNKGNSGNPPPIDPIRWKAL